MTRKLLILLAVLLLTLSLTGCAGQVEKVDTLEPISSDADWAPAEAAGFEDNLDGLCQYMEANNAVTGEKVEMSYREIGAVGGVRYRFKFDGSTVQAEFYEYDLDNQDEKAKECLGSVQEKGSFTILGNEVPAVLNGKYLMIYTDTDKDEANTAQREQVLKLFQEFKKA